MLYDFIIADKNAKEPMYRQIYISIRTSIENGNLKKNSKLPSIRRLSEGLGVSKTTVIAAYDQLCAEGYLMTKPQSGFFVAAQFENRRKAVEIKDNISNNENKYYKYDFSGKSIDDKIINLAEWKKEVKDIINRNYLLTSYGDAQGENTLRIALQKYALGTRSVVSSAGNIVVGAGTQALLFQLCSILGQYKKVAVQKAGYVQSEFVFKSFGYEIYYFECDLSGVTVSSLEKIKPDIILINPNFSGTSGTNMPVTRRLEIIKWAAENHALIIEDDYNGELRYSTHPMPCVQNYDPENTIYIGSFSKVLLPSVRISYMVLPERLMTEFNRIKPLINQTASKTEQLALAAYINTNKIDAHLRKARRIYLDKSRVMLESIEKYIPDCETIFNETSMYVSIMLKNKVNRDKIDKELEESSVCLMPNNKTDNEFGISFSGIPIEKIDAGIKSLGKILKESCD